jgi:pimeloyl-ACP methyl ester carboxylesterase
MTKYNEGFFPAVELNPIFFRSWTPDKAKITLLYVHGAAGTSADCVPLAQQLSTEEGIRVVAFDSPGNGYSQANAGFSSVVVQRMVIEKLVQTAKTPVALLATSGGAISTFVCLDLHRTEPEFNQIPVIFAEPGLIFDEKTADYLQLISNFLSARYASLDEACRTWDQTPLGSILFDNQSDKVDYIRGMLQVQENALTPLTRTKDVKVIKHFNLLNDKEPLSNPSLVLWGEKGGIKERMENQLDRVLTNQIKIEFQGAGHPLSLTRSVEINAIAQFLRQYARV